MGIGLGGFIKQTSQLGTQLDFQFELRVVGKDLQSNGADGTPILVPGIGVCVVTALITLAAICDLCLFCPLCPPCTPGYTATLRSLSFFLRLLRSQLTPP